MAHYAILNENNLVVNVLVGKDQTDHFLYEYWEEYYGNIFGMKCKRTSYNTFKNKNLVTGIAFRGNYAGIGYSYNEELDAFIPPKLFESWILNEETADWESPIGPAPELTQEQINSGSFYVWNEESYQSDNTSGWILITPETSTEEEPPVE